MSSAPPCLFCAIVTAEAGTMLGPEAGAEVVLDEAEVVGFLDHRPLFPGHVLVVPRDHHETLTDLPGPLVAVVFGAVRRVTAAVVAATGAEGSFVAINNRVSQSVPHLHVHVVPRRRKDGLRGFFWPRQRYASPGEATTVANAIRSALTPPD